MDVIIAILSVIYILFLPGLFWSLVLFKPGKIDLIERIALSFVLSIGIVPLIVFYGNLLGIKITSLSVLIYVLIIIGIATIILLIQRKRKL